MEEKEILLELTQLVQAGEIQRFKERVSHIPPVDIAEAMEEQDKDLVVRLFRLLPKDISADVFSYMSAEEQRVIVESMSGLEIRHLMDEMFMDDTVDFLEEMPATQISTASVPLNCW